MSLTPLPPLSIVISKTADGQFDYMQIVSADQFALNVVLISGKITIRDARPPEMGPKAKKG